jgi:hypothetical protein
MRTNLSPQLPHLDWNVFGDGFRGSMIPDQVPALEEHGDTDGQNETGVVAAGEDLRATA